MAHLRSRRPPFVHASRTPRSHPRRVDIFGPPRALRASHLAGTRGCAAKPGLFPAPKRGPARNQLPPPAPPTPATPGQRDRPARGRRGAVGADSDSWPCSRRLSPGPAALLLSTLLRALPGPTRAVWTLFGPPRAIRGVTPRGHPRMCREAGTISFRPQNAGRPGPAPATRTRPDLRSRQPAFVHASRGLTGPTREAWTISARPGLFAACRTPPRHPRMCREAGDIFRPRSRARPGNAAPATRPSTPATPGQQGRLR